MNPHTPSEKQLERARKILAHLEEQAAGYTALTIPAHLALELEEQRERVTALEAQRKTPPQSNVVGAIDRVRLRNNLTAYFSLGELRTLCFDMDIPHEDMPQTKSGMARGIIEYCERRLRLDELVAVCRHLRPQVEW